MLIRTENPQDIIAITQLIEEAFKSHPYSEGTESQIVCALRESNALALSLVAETDDHHIIGYIAFSKVMINGTDFNMYGVGPLAVLPKYQCQGIGSALMVQGLSTIRHMKANGCILAGDMSYYHRFGFQASSALRIPSIPEQHVLSQRFNPPFPAGEVQFHPAFSTPSTH